MARPSRFSPRSEAPEALEARTVCRDELCESIVTSMTEAVCSGQARFELLLGPRGAGKSHLLGLVEGRLRRRLANDAVVAGLPEELHPSSLLHLLAEILRAFPSEPGGATERQLGVLAATAPEEAQERAVGMIRARLAQRPLVLLLENLDLVFAAIGRDGQQRLRNILQTERSWSIVATSRTRSAAFFEEAEPFYGTFIPRTLEPLSAECCREMLVRLARAHGREALAEEMGTAEGLVRAQTLRHVLGGQPRAMAFIFPHLHHDRPDAVEDALQDLAEELTPYFQEQMSRLSPGQRPIVELLAEHWGPLSVGEIAQATFTAPSSVSTHLRRLRQESIVRSTKLGREQYYEIADPLFRIARAMKRDEVRARTFLRVLKGWYAFRGVDVWRLPPQTWQKYIADDFELNEFRAKRLELLADEIRSGKLVEVLERDDGVDGGDPLLRSARIVALERMGRQSQALQELQTTRQDELLAVIFGIVRFAHAGESSSSKLVLSLGHERKLPLVARLALAIEITIYWILPIPAANAFIVDTTLPEAIEVIEACLAAPDPDDRAAVSKVVEAAMIPFALAKVEEWTLCGRVLAALVPTAEESLSYNLASVVNWAWSRGRLSEVFLRSPESAWRLTEHLGSRPKWGMLLAMHDADVPLPVGFESFAMRVHAGDEVVDSSDLGVANQVWFVVIITTMASALPDVQEELVAQIKWKEVALFLSGILARIAVGRELSPLRSALSWLRKLDPSHGLASIVDVTDPDVAYARLAAPERALVIQLAQSYELHDRVAALRALSSEDDFASPVAAEPE